MNYFDLFDIPVQLRVDGKDLHKKYIALSRRLHPDFFANESEELKESASQKTANLNMAWLTLRNPMLTIKYVLEQKGLLTNDEQYALPSGFLMEMMEVNEELMELDGEDREALEKFEQKIADYEQQYDDSVALIVENYQEGTTTQEELLQVKLYYYQKKYLNRIKEQLTNNANVNEK